MQILVTVSVTFWYKDANIVTHTTSLHQLLAIWFLTMFQCYLGEATPIDIAKHYSLTD